MNSSKVRRLLGPLADPVSRSRLSLMYLAHPKSLVRRAYAHLEYTTLRRNTALMLPPRVKLNTGYYCNLRCPLCPTGVRDPHPAVQLTIETTRFLLPYLKEIGIVSLYGWAEPFLSRDIFKIIRLLKANSIYVQIDTNLSIANQKIVEKIAESPIDLLSISLDGADEQSYVQYRVGGSFELVIRNIRQLKASKRGPQRIQWQYLISRKNYMLVDRAKALGNELGVEMVFMDIGMYNDMFHESSEDIKREWWTDEQMARLGNPSSNSCQDVCSYMYNDPFIDPDGKVYPCCHAAYAPQELLEAGYHNVFGDLHRNTLKEIWNNDYYKRARSLFTGLPSAQNYVKPICLKCKLYLQHDPAFGNVKTRPLKSHQQLIPITPHRPNQDHVKLPAVTSESSSETSGGGH